MASYIYGAIINEMAEAIYNSQMSIKGNDNNKINFKTSSAETIREYQDLARRAFYVIEKNGLLKTN